MRREWLLAAALLASGCSHSDEGAVASVSSGPATVDSAAPSSGPTPVSGVTQLPAGPGATIEVSGGLLPTSVTSGITSKGGELADTASWDARYETFGLPRVDGPGARLVAGEIEATAVDDGWQRRDALQWLLMDVSHPSLVAILDDLAAAAEIEGWELDESEQTVSNGECVERRYSNSATSTTWKLSGCSYPDFAGMFAVAVERSGVFANAPSPVDPSVAAVAEGVHGRVTAVSVFYGQPTSTGSAATLTATATVAFAASLDEANATLTAGPLAGWTASPGEGSVRFSGGMGTRWVVSSGEATLTASGRLLS